MSMLPAGPVFIGSDHAGFALKNTLAAHLSEQGVEVRDVGAYSEASCDYPDAAHKVCRAVRAEGGWGILVCGSGLGMCMAANRHQGIRAALCVHEAHARTAREHNNANVICLGQRISAKELALELLNIFRSTRYEGGRHERRIALIENT